MMSYILKNLTVLSLDPVVGAIAAGNAVVLKPSEIAPATSSLLAKLLPKYVDNTLIKVIEGAVNETSALLEQKWDKIFYTGSGRVGRIVMAAAAKHLTPVILELGGKCPAVVDSDVNLQVQFFVICKCNSTFNLSFCFCKVKILIVGCCKADHSRKMVLQQRTDLHCCRLCYYY